MLMQIIATASKERNLPHTHKQQQTTNPKEHHAFPRAASSLLFLALFPCLRLTTLGAFHSFLTTNSEQQARVRAVVRTLR